MPVSVIIPVYNRCRHVAKAVESVLGQTYRDLELIIVDDASTDGTSEILADLATKDSRITLIRQTVNKGGATGRNLALTLARHDLVACMDDDDIMLPDRLELQVAFMEAHPDVSVLSSAAHMIDENDQIIGLSVPTIDLERGKRAFDPNYFVNIIHPTAMYRKNDVLRLGGYRKFLLDDRDLWGRMVTAGYKIAVSPDPVLLHRRHSSIMTTKIREIFEVGDYIDFNIVRRMHGEPEMSVEEYRRVVSLRPRWNKFMTWKSRNAAIAFRLATLYYSKKSWLPFSYNLSKAIALEPVRYVRRVLLKKPQHMFGRGATPAWNRQAQAVSAQPSS